MYLKLSMLHSRFQNEAEQLREARESTEEEIGRLKLAEKEVEQVHVHATLFQPTMNVKFSLKFNLN